MTSKKQFTDFVSRIIIAELFNMSNQFIFFFVLFIVLFHWSVAALYECHI